jgi:hypothetical protein
MADNKYKTPSEVSIVLTVLGLIIFIGLSWLTGFGGGGKEKQRTLDWMYVGANLVVILLLVFIFNRGERQFWPTFKSVILPIAFAWGGLAILVFTQMVIELFI